MRSDANAARRICTRTKQELDLCRRVNKRLDIIITAEHKQSNLGQLESKKSAPGEDSSVSLDIWKEKGDADRDQLPQKLQRESRDQSVM